MATLILLAFLPNVTDDFLKRRFILLMACLPATLGTAGFLMGKKISVSAIRMIDSIERITSGDLLHRTEIETATEIGELGTSINKLADRLQTLSGDLEASRAEGVRTYSYLYASAEVSQVANSFLDTEKLLRLVVELIRARFKLYYVGIYLIDESYEWAVLRAGTGEAGQTLLERGYRVRLGEGMVGWSIKNASSRVASNGHNDEHWQANPDLPDICAEAVLPLRSRGQVIGALSVDSTSADAFDETALAVLQTIADQVGIAIDNARLFAESQENLQKMKDAFAEANQKAWMEVLRNRTTSGYRSSELGVLPFAEEDDLQDDTDRMQQISFPIHVRGHSLGMLEARKGPNLGWTSEEVNLVKTLVEQLNIALEGARLYDETRRRAERERLAGQITARLRASNDPQEIVQIAMLELRNALHADRAQISIQPGTPSAAPGIPGGNGNRPGED